MTALALAVALSSCTWLQPTNEWKLVGPTGYENFHGVLYIDLDGVALPFQEETACTAKVRVDFDGRRVMAIDTAAVYYPAEGRHPAQLVIFGVGIYGQVKPEKMDLGPADMDWLYRSIASIEVKRR